MNRPERRAALRGFLATVAADAAFAPATGPRRLHLANGRTVRCLAAATLRDFGHVSALTRGGLVMQLLASEVAQ